MENIQSEKPDTTNHDTNEYVDKPADNENPVNYEERHSYFLSELEQKTKTDKAPVVIAYIVDPKMPTKPIMYVRGHPYKTAQAACDLARYLKAKLVTSDDLSV